MRWFQTLHTQRWCARVALLSLALVVLYAGGRSIRSTHAQEFVDNPATETVEPSPAPGEAGAQAGGRRVATEDVAATDEGCGRQVHEAAPLGTEIDIEELQNIKQGNPPHPREDEVQQDPAP